MKVQIKNQAVVKQPQEQEYVKKNLPNITLEELLNEIASSNSRRQEVDSDIARLKKENEKLRERLAATEQVFKLFENLYQEE